jgi:hypothetical protein
MKHSEFRIGFEFGCGGTRWRCTDVGTRIITAISLDPHEVMEIPSKGGLAQSRIGRHITDDPDWLLGSAV